MFSAALVSTGKRSQKPPDRVGAVLALYYCCYAQPLKDTLVALLLGLCAGVAGSDKRNWQTGKTISSERQQIRPHGANCVYQDFEFGGDTKIYTAREPLKWRWSKEANLTVNAQVKFAVDARERKLFVIDEDGKEHEMKIIKKVLRPTPAETSK